MKEIVTAYACEVCGQEYPVKEVDKARGCENTCKIDSHHINIAMYQLKAGQALKVRKSDVRGFRWRTEEEREKKLEW